MTYAALIFAACIAWLALRDLWARFNATMHDV